MSVGNSAGISFSGLSSGIDTDSLIRQLTTLERQPITRLRTQQAMLQTRKSAYETFKNQLVALNTAASAFNNPGAFDGMKSTSSNTDLVSFSATSTAPIGIREIKVNRLATAERLSSAAQTSSSTALGYSGTFKINDISVSVTSTDTLQNIAKKINDANSGATATIVDGGTGHAFLSLTSGKTGEANKIKLEQVGASGPISNREGVLSQLGLAQITSYQGNLDGFQSELVGSSSQTLNDALGLSEGTRIVKVNNQDIEVDFTSDTLTTVAQKIKNITGVDARITTDIGGSRLEVFGDAPFTILGLDELNMTPRSIAVDLASQSPTILVAAQDAQYVLDGITLTSDSNTLTSVIPGASITLKQADPSKTVNLTIERDTEGVMTTVKGLMTAYNRVNSFIRDNSKFDATSYDTGILFGDSVASQVSGSLNATLFASVSGLTSTFRNLTQIGFSLDQAGNVTVDDTVLRNAINSSPTEVANLLRSVGSSTNSAISYVSSSNKTKASPTDGFDLVVTQLATQTKITGAQAQTGPTATEEVLSFTGTQFGTSGIALVIPAGSSQTDVVNKINNDSRLKSSVTASVVDGKITLTSSRYGTASDFVVSSSAAATATSSGIGTAGQAVKTVGVDVQGTINGEEATGSGRFLLGKAGNANTDGLQLEYTGTATGTVGKVKFSRGIGAMMYDSLDTFINFQDGLFVNTGKALDDQIADIDSQIDRINTRADSKAADLRARFSAMEAAMQRSQQQLAQLQRTLGSQ